MAKRSSRSIGLFSLLAVFSAVLLTLKVSGLFITGGAFVTGSVDVAAQEAKQNPSETPAKAADPDKSASDKKGAGEPTKQTSKEDAKDAKVDTKQAKDEGKKKDPKENDESLAMNPSKKDVAGSELAILQSLGNRRTELEKREKELDLRLLVLKAAESRVEARIGELKKIESSILANIEQSDEKRKQEFLDLVAMYNKMKPKKAAVIFEGLKESVLVSIVKKMKSTNVAKIIGAMNPQKAQELTHLIAQSTHAKTASQFKKKALPQVPSEGDATQ